MDFGVGHRRREGKVVGFPVSGFSLIPPVRDRHHLAHLAPRCTGCSQFHCAGIATPSQRRRSQDSSTRNCDLNSSSVSGRRPFRFVKALDGQGGQGEALPRDGLVPARNKDRIGGQQTTG